MAITMQGAPADLLHGAPAAAAQLLLTFLAKPSRAQVRDGAWIAQISSSIGACPNLLVHCSDFSRTLCSKAQRHLLGIGGRHVSELLFESYKNALRFGVAQPVCQQLLPADGSVIHAAGDPGCAPAA